MYVTSLRGIQYVLSLDLNSPGSICVYQGEACSGKRKGPIVSAFGLSPTDFQQKSVGQP